jgi:hypothetical protein
VRTNRRQGWGSRPDAQMISNGDPQVAMVGMVRIPHRGRIAASPSRAGDLLWEVVFRGSGGLHPYRRLSPHCRFICCAPEARR